MPLGLISTQDQLAAFRDSADSGVVFVHVDTCIGCYLQDHHNRDGECLFGVYVDGTTTVGDVRKMLQDEVRSTGDRVDSYVADEAIAAALDAWFANLDPARLFDASLEVPELDEDGDPIDNDDAAEGCQAWFVLTWTTHAATLRDRQDVETVNVLPGDLFEVTDDVGSSMTGTFDEVTAWLDAGLPDAVEGGDATSDV